jgi:ABC-2 type transport system ATP-binding protein
VRRLVKRYGRLTAVDDVSLEVQAGDFFALLGPNGAGKTTTINSIVGLARIDSGSVAVFGYDTAAEFRSARRLVGLAPQEYNFDRFLSIRDILIYQAGYYGLRGAAIGRRADDLLERFDLADKRKETYTRLSGGMKRRLTLARALIHEPKLLILDEPTAGVDVELRLELWDLLRKLNRDGMTIVLTTHYLEEAELLCRNVGIIERGKVVALESTESLLARANRSTLVVTLDRAPAAVPPALAAYGPHANGSPRTIEFENVEAARVGSILVELERAGYHIEDVELRRTSLQDVFLDLTGRA